MLANITLVVQLAVGLVFLRSTVGKLLAPRAFAEGIHQYGVPDYAAYPVAALVIAAEATAAAAYVSGWNVRLVSPLSAGLLIVFLVVVVVALRRNLHVKCLCFGASGQEQISQQTVWRIVSMLAAALFVAVQSWRDAGLLRPHELAGDRAVLAFGSALVLLAIVMWSYGAPALRSMFADCWACAARSSKGLGDTPEGV
jgi:uncharacterized membrane protein YphA (DoxX/SURF4 family)